MTKKCLKCSNCTGLKSTWSCSCGLKYQDHFTLIETRAERIQNGRATSEVEQILNDNMIHGRIEGNVQNFMDLVDHNERFGAQAEAYETKQLNYQNKNQLEYPGHPAHVSSKILVTGMNSLKDHSSQTFQNGLTYQGKPIQKVPHNQHTSEVAIRAQQELDAIEQTPSAFHLFKRPHKFARQ